MRAKLGMGEEKLIHVAKESFFGPGFRRKISKLTGSLGEQAQGVTGLGE